MPVSSVRPDDPVAALNTVLYCRHWRRSVAFYQHLLGLERGETCDWFVEFRVAPGAALSLVDEARATVGSAGGAGVTLTLRVSDLDSWHRHLAAAGAAPGPVHPRPFGAIGFFLRDPEGTRIELWAPAVAGPPGP